MAMSRFGKALVSATTANIYETSYYDAEDEAMGLSRFHTEDPANFVLCADDIVRMMGFVENPNCPLADFYAGRCGACTSLNYLSCSKPVSFYGQWKADFIATAIAAFMDRLSEALQDIFSQDDASINNNTTGNLFWMLEGSLDERTDGSSSRQSIK